MERESSSLSTAQVPIWSLKDRTLLKLPLGIFTPSVEHSLLTVHPSCLCFGVRQGRRAARAVCSHRDSLKALTTAGIRVFDNKHYSQCYVVYERNGEEKNVPLHKQV